MPSKQSVVKAREQLRILLGLTRGQRMQFKIISIGYDEVTFSYGGYEINFSVRDGRLTRDGGDHIYLQEDDYKLLFLLATQILEARKKHVKNQRQRKKKPVVPSHSQSEFTF